MTLAQAASPDRRRRTHLITVITTVLVSFTLAVLHPPLRAEAADATPMTFVLSKSAFTSGDYYTAALDTTDTLRTTVGHNNATLSLQIMVKDSNGNYNAVDAQSGKTADQLSTYLQRTGSAGAYHHTFVISNWERYMSTNGNYVRIWDSTTRKVIAESKFFSYRLPIVVNQVGYRPNQTKTAYILTPGPILGYDGWTDNAAGNRWNIRLYKPVDGGRVSVWSRTYTDAELLTALKSTGSKDAATGYYVYEIDFSDYTGEADGLYFDVTDKNGNTLPLRSWQFSVGNQAVTNAYRQMSKDALVYFYFHRLGFDTSADPIYLFQSEANYATQDERIAAARAHGHGVFDGLAVPCFKNLACAQGQTIPAMNAWADAGDFGVYPVNTAAAAWQLMNIIEFDEVTSTQVAPTLPEMVNTNVAVAETKTASAIMREVLYGTYYMAMTDWNKVTNMPHKIHNQDWSDVNTWDPETEFDVLPATSSSKDYFQRSATIGSTAASYANCRVQAQEARVMYLNSTANQFDGVSALRTQYLDRAYQWYLEAINTPVSLYPSTNAADAQNKFSIGGGPYGDKNIADDKYACMVELYLALYAFSPTDPRTRAFVTGIKADPLFADNSVRYDVDYWSNPLTMANLSLLVTKNDFWTLDGGVKINMILGNLATTSSSIRSKVVGTSTAAEYPALRGNETWPWASNAEALNAVMLLNYDIKFNSGGAKDANAAYELMGYVLGANAQNKSFVTGYGANAETDTHDRMAWWAYRTSGTKYPKGWLAGGAMTDIGSCMSGGEVNYNGDPSYERGTPFWKTGVAGFVDGSGDDTKDKRLTDELISTHEAYGATFTTSAGNKSGQDLTKLLSEAVRFSNAYPTFSVGTRIKPALSYAKPYTAPWSWCSKENAVNYNSALVWAAAAATNYMSDGITP